MADRDNAAPQGLDKSVWYAAITTAETQGTTVTATIRYRRNGSGTWASLTGVSVTCPMLDSNAIVPIGVQFLARRGGGVWEGMMNVYYPEA